jgi:hypothetical protein
MSFSNYKEIEQVQIEFNIRWKEENFINAKAIKISEEFLKEYQFKLEVIDFRASEAARTETLIFPILLEVYKDYHNKFSLWIQKSISAGKNLSGTPDYLVSIKSELGKTVLGKPLVAVVEAKKNDFDTGWGQCLAELVALQKINNNENIVVYGIVTDGERWEFGKLEKDIFFENKTTFTNEDLPYLFGALHFIFQSFQ